MSMNNKMVLAGIGLVGGFLLIDHLTAPMVSRPVYNGYEECLADWANKPQDCVEEESTISNVRVRRWYGPWLDRSSGDVYHSDGSRSVRTSGTLHVAAYSETRRMGFGSSSSGRGG